MAKKMGKMLRRLFCVCSIINLILIFSSLNLNAQIISLDNPCIFCHIDISYVFPKFDHGKNGLTCISCHGESKEHIHVEDNSIKPDLELTFIKVHKLCQNCHKDVYEKYIKSRHAEIIKENYESRVNPELPGCTACHKVHTQAN